MDKTKSIRISEETHRQLLKAKQETGASVTWLIDVAVEEWLTKRLPKLSHTVMNEKEVYI